MAQVVPVGIAQLHAGVARDGDEMRVGIRGAADGGVHGDGVAERIVRQDRGRPQVLMPDPALAPSCQPSSIGPPDRMIDGTSTVAAAISAAGVVLSHPVVNTTASIG